MNELTNPIKGQKQKPMNGQARSLEPMNEIVFQSIMGEYLIDCTEYYENQGIRRCYAINDEPGLRKILENEY